MAITTRIEALKKLGLPVGASSSDIKNAYKELSKKYHPDVVGEEYSYLFVEINEAYSFLNNNPVPARKVLGGDEKAMMRYQTQRNNRDMAKRYEFKDKKRKKEKEAALEKAAKEARQRRKEEQARKLEAEKEAKRQIKAMEMAIVISRMLGENKD
ncbi:MAG TPA: hypothetical protein DCR12_07310 [Lachnospiraceae bacterium]|nr:hypothetical protein [Lachnospiraceae bacterium]